MKQEVPMERPGGLLGLLLDVYDKPVAVRVGSTLVKVAWVNMQPDCAVLELDSAEMELAVEDLVLNSITSARSRAARSETPPSTRT